MLNDRQNLYLPAADVYKPFEDQGNPTKPADAEILNGVLLQRAIAKGAYEDFMAIPLESRWGSCTSLIDISEKAFCTSLNWLFYHWRQNRDNFRHGLRVGLNGDVFGRQSVRGFHWRLWGSGPDGGDLGPYITDSNGNEMVDPKDFPTDFVLHPTVGWSIEEHPTPYAGVDVFLVPPEYLWREHGLEAFTHSLAEMTELLLTLRRLMAANLLNYAWGYRLIIQRGPDARQTPVPGMPFEVRLLAGGMEPGGDLPRPQYQDGGRYTLPAISSDAERKQMGDALEGRAAQLGQRLYGGWGEKLGWYRSRFPKE